MLLGCYYLSRTSRQWAGGAGRGAGKSGPGNSARWVHACESSTRRSPALRQFGNEKTTLNDVARVAGLARQTIYRYFPNRAALLEGVEISRTPAPRRGGPDRRVLRLLRGVHRRAGRVQPGDSQPQPYGFDSTWSSWTSVCCTPCSCPVSSEASLLRELVGPQLSGASDRGELRLARAG